MVKIKRFLLNMITNIKSSVIFTIGYKFINFIVRMFKRFILNMTTSIGFSIVIFLIINVGFTIRYKFINIVKDEYSTGFMCLHTFIATFTLTIPKFIDDNELGKCLGLDITIFAHMFVAYLFLGILISMLYRKLIRA